MSRYIDVDKLKQELDEWAINLHKPTNLVRDDTFVIIDEQPTADVVEIRHGYWKVYKDLGYRFVKNYQCSECGDIIGDVNYNYCPNCGAKMDGESDE